MNPSTSHGMTTRAHVTPAPLALSFMSANYVAEELGYGAATEWGPFDVATNAAFEPLESFAPRFDALLARITGIGFDTIDLWFGHLNWRWATPEHVACARETLERHAVGVSSLAGSVGATVDDIAAACRLANALDVDLIAGVGEVVHRDREGAAAVLRDHGVRFGLENHPEKTPERCSPRSETRPTCSAPQSTRAGGRRSRTTRFEAIGCALPADSSMCT